MVQKENLGSKTINGKTLTKYSRANWQIVRVTKYSLVDKQAV